MPSRRLLLPFVCCYVFACAVNGGPQPEGAAGAAPEYPAAAPSSADFDSATVPLLRDAPAARTPVRDFGGLFDEGQRGRLSDLLLDYNARTGHEVVIATVDEIAPYEDVRAYATDLANYWGVGSAERDDGLLLVVCAPCGKAGIATGRGTERVLTDSVCAGVMSGVMVPAYRRGDYYGGTVAGVEALLARWP